MVSNRCRPDSIIFAFFLIASFSPVAAQEKTGHPTEIHTHHPQNWRFALPKGDPAKGRKVFEKFQCYFCHEVRGENFPFAGVDYGPELSQMGRMHPLEYFAESVTNPSAWESKQDRGPDGKSKMPEYNDRMTVQELIDLSAYLASLRPKDVPKSVSGEGKIVAVVPESAQIVLQHDEIKDFMDAMTMGYKVSSPSLLKAAKPGDKVRFTIDTEKLVITKIVKITN
jgi:L-cysteine S-thiosulfotransferase